MSKEQIFLAGFIVVAFLVLTLFQVIYRPTQIIMPDHFIVITTVAVCFLCMGGWQR